MPGPWCRTTLAANDVSTLAYVNVINSRAAAEFSGDKIHCSSSVDKLVARR